MTNPVLKILLGIFLSLAIWGHPACLLAQSLPSQPQPQASPPQASAPAPGADFEFYKKNGHTNKDWNDFVKQGFEAYEQQNCDSALTSLKQAVGAQCQDALVFFKMAACSELIDSPYTALQYYQLAQEKLDKLNVSHRYKTEIYESYGRALFKAVRYDQAFPLLTKAVALGTPSFALNYMVGFLYSKKGDSQAALDSFTRALTYDTTGVPPTLLSSVYREVAKAQVQLKNYQAATPLLEKAFQLNPNDPEVVKMKNESSLGLQQNSMIQMIQSLSDPNHTKTSDSGSQPPPPAAAKLPPLESQPTLKDPTPPLGIPSSQTTLPPRSNPAPPAPAPQAPPAVSMPTTGVGSTPIKLEPLPPMKP